MTDLHRLVTTVLVAAALLTTGCVDDEALAAEAEALRLALAGPLLTRLDSLEAAVVVLENETVAQAVLLENLGGADLAALLPRVAALEAAVGIPYLPGDTLDARVVALEAADFLTEETDPIATSAGYLTGYTEVDPVASAAGYLTAESDPLATSAGYLTATSALVTSLQDDVAFVVDELDGDCPLGYVRDFSETEFVLCADPATAPNAPDEMVQVGSFWIDRFEASLWTAATCDGTQYGLTAGDYPSSFPASGDWTLPLYACSVANVSPGTDMTWFQAEQGCSAAGKSLCTNAQWQAAAAGTWDPSSNDGSLGGACHTQGPSARATGNAGGEPGAVTSCTSVYGADDMIGNQAEWTADWYVGGRAWMSGDGDAIAPWGANYGDGLDKVWGFDGRAFNGTTWMDALPAAGRRGGSTAEGVTAGTFNVFANSSPSAPAARTGFRCCLTR